MKILKCKFLKHTNFGSWTDSDEHDWAKAVDELGTVTLMCVNCKIKKVVDWGEQVTDYLGGMF